MEEQAISIIGIFDLLTPDEVSRITQTASKRAAKSLSAVEAVESSLNDEGVVDVTRISKSPKILPIEEKTENSEDNVINLFKEKDKREQYYFSECEEVLSSLESSQVSAVATVGGGALAEMGIHSKDEIEHMEQEQERQRLSSQPSASSFLLKERSKIKRSQKRLNNQKAINSYKSNSKVDIKAKSNEDEDSDKSKGEGVLLNRKQY